MAEAVEVRVGHRPERPLVVFDGDCGFCRQWIGRWRALTGDRVDYRPYQEASGLFPEIGEEGFRRKLWLVEPDGRAVGGMKAVLRLYGLLGEKRGWAWLYDHSPGFAAVAERVYGVVAGHRNTSDFLARWLWGGLSERPRYRRMRSVFLRALGLIYLSAFWSLAVQVDGLIGSRGILPAREYLDGARTFLGPKCYRELPTLLWLDPSDRMLHVLCWGGVALGALLAAGIMPGACALLLWLFYLSLTVAGQQFLAFQWDSLLLEAGLLAVLFAPWTVTIGRARAEPSRGVVWLLRWLVFRLMFLSGLVKLTSGDPTWKAWEALRYHYESQPLPSWTSWYMHQLPPWFQAVSIGFMFWAELIAPFLVFGPRRVRMVGFWSLVLLQVLILATGNYGFFNLLSIVLCLSLVEDRDWGRKAPGEVARRPWLAGKAVVGALGAVLVVVTSMEVIEELWPALPFPDALERLRVAVAPIRSANRYGLFRVMTTDRPEILVEGSDDGEVWTPYRFRWKPGDPGHRPRFTTPHLPRLDWQMWFAALARDCRNQPWFLRFEERLLEGTPEVTRLLLENPFPDHPPRYLRARLFLYHFTTWGDRDWWRREEVGAYCPAVGLGPPDVPPPELMEPQ